MTHGAGPVLGAVVPSLANAVVGVAAGAVVLGVVTAVKRALGRDKHAP